MRVEVLGFDELDARTAYDVWRLRQAVFVVEQHCAYPDLDGRDPEPATRHVVARHEDAVVGYLRVVADHDDPQVARIGRVVVEPSWRGHGVAELLMTAGLGVVDDRASVLDAQSGLTAWYARWGYVVSGPEFDDDGVLHRPMTRAPQSPPGRSSHN